MEIFIAILSGGLLSTLVSFLVTRKSTKSTLKKTELESINLKLETLNKLNEYTVKEIEFYHSHIDYLKDVSAKYEDRTKLNELKQKMDNISNTEEDLLEIGRELKDYEEAYKKIKEDSERKEAMYKIVKESGDAFMKIRKKAFESLDE